MSLNEAPIWDGIPGTKRISISLSPKQLTKAATQRRVRHYKMKPICVAQQTENANKQRLARWAGKTTANGSRSGSKVAVEMEMEMEMHTT